jgi:hypothetical protein
VDHPAVHLLRRAKIMKLVNINGEREVFGRNAAVKLIIAMDHCPQCGLLPEEHRDEECDLHYAPETEYREEQWLP